MAAVAAPKFEPARVAMVRLTGSRAVALISEGGRHAALGRWSARETETIPHSEELH